MRMKGRDHHTYFMRIATTARAGSPYLFHAYCDHRKGGITILISCVLRPPQGRDHHTYFMRIVTTARAGSQYLFHAHCDMLEASKLGKRSAQRQEVVVVPRFSAEVTNDSVTS